MPARRVTVADESDAGSVVLNYCDPEYPIPRQRDATPEELLLRLIAYIPFASRVNIAAEYVFDGPALFDALKVAPTLLHEGVVAPDILAEVQSFTEMTSAPATLRQSNSRLPHAPIAAEFLDTHATVVREYPAEDMGATFHQALLDDISPRGALRRVVGSAMRPGSRHKRAFDRSHERLSAEPSISRQGFVELVGAELEGHRNTLRRWAGLRYYTVPLAYDPVRLRELPDSAASLARRGRVGLATEPGVLGPLPEPMDQVARRLRVLLPRLDEDWFQKAEALASAVLSARESIPEAQDVFRRIVASEEANELQAEVSARLAREYARQLGEIPNNRFLTVGLEGAALGLGVTFDLIGLSPLGAAAVGVGAATAVGFTRNITLRRAERQARPWVMVTAQLERQLARQLRRRRRRWPRSSR